MSAFDIVLGKKTAPLDITDLSERREGRSPVVMDVGTGQGKFVLDMARDFPDKLVIGVDAVAENMAKSARSAGASPKKGGLPNALFVRAAAERLPGPFQGLVDELTVQYPWGSLMRIVSEPSLEHLRLLRGVCRTGASLSVLLNYSVFEDRPYLERLGMGDIEDPADSDVLPEIYGAAGFRMTHRALIHGDPPVRTAWGRHLVRGSARSTLMIDAVAED
ncbi:MAG: methyltransferase domain-containing protein [Alphaproteobacteria bacterium]|nr:methyltransferase domain-containing protein [Alphaproteobacteria bacterium]